MTKHDELTKLGNGNTPTDQEYIDRLSKIVSSIVDCAGYDPPLKSSLKAPSRMESDREIGDCCMLNDADRKLRSIILLGRNEGSSDCNIPIDITVLSHGELEIYLHVDKPGLRLCPGDITKAFDILGKMIRKNLNAQS